ncbi:MAG: hypothetical protein M3R51_05585 [Candidatus Eremiobacteraeota bacterium]|nr:hypothetical protein [Candidatus Eremiobacteraeota bacterium]
MKRTLLALCAVLGASASAVPAIDAATATPPPKKNACDAMPSKFQRDKCKSFTKSAPGDEYFGRLKLSYLGINNTFRDQTIRAGSSTIDSDIINKVANADEALRAWMQRYPGDPQLARSLYLATEIYKRIYTEEAQDKAWKYMQLEVRQFPATYFGKIVKKNIAIGFTEHYYAPTLVCPTPLPSDAPLPSTTPAASPTPSPAPGGAKVDIIVPPCTKPNPEPTETPSEAPSMSPLPSSSASPSTSSAPSPSAAATSSPSAVPAPAPAASPSPAPAPSASPAPAPSPMPSAVAVPSPVPPATPSASP